MVADHSSKHGCDRAIGVLLAAQNDINVQQNYLARMYDYKRPRSCRECSEAMRLRKAL